MNVIIKKSKYDVIGSGSSYRMLDFAERLKKQFGLKFNKEDIVFTSEDFVRKLESVENDSIIIFDEVDFGIKQWDQK